MRKSKTKTSFVGEKDRGERERERGGGGERGRGKREGERGGEIER